MNIVLGLLAKLRIKLSEIKGLESYGIDSDIDELLLEVDKSSFDTLAEEAHRTSVEHGFYETPPAFFERIVHMHGELSEAYEEHRSGHEPTEIYYNPEKPDKPEGIPIELADVVIRILGASAYYKIDLLHAIKLKMAYNKSRPYKHGRVR